jgi:ubiquinone/menaquinone biosynthesis C-methylase UbiE
MSNDQTFDLVICSFALHLVGDASEMFSLLYELSQRAKWLAVVAPHKKPEVSALVSSDYGSRY